MKNGKKHLFLGFFLALLLVSALAIANIKQPQETRTHAAAGTTTLKLTPASASKQVGDTISLDIMVDPGENLVSFVKFQVTFDPTKLALVTADPFTLNTTDFPVKVEGPVTNAESIGESVSIGADPTKVIQQVTKVGTLHFKAVGGTNNTPTMIAFSNISQALSAGTNDAARINVLSGTTPAAITIGGTSNLSPTVVVDPCPAFCPSITPGQQVQGRQPLLQFYCMG